VSDTIIQALFPKLSWMLPARYHEVNVAYLGQAMRRNAELKGQGEEILEYPDYVRVHKQHAEQFGANA
jgi:hypothetical protein